ncbi:mitochondrial ribonuclease P catalytic subunit-like [Contarinia nasturtii]|uniref:mitochondrial ribonuclease P catalytic subunit-like n=1 Tax=Contarinia nasturtii TaxID=265458 RepID=UPI0012D45777|nr:mitochondrial ribonuclease P catalytic subunit-like [Contarinia nasturtii]
MFMILRKTSICGNSKPFQQVSNYAKIFKLLISKEERAAKLQKERFELVRTCITSALKNRRSLSVSEFRTIESEMRSKSYHRIRDHIFDVFFTLRPPNDSMENARNFIEAFDIKDDLNITSKLIRLYAKKASESQLTEKEEQELIGRCDALIAKEFHALPEMNSIIVNGLCATKDWRKVIELPALCKNSVNIIARKALKENEIDMAWDVLHKLFSFPKHHQHLNSKTIQSVAKYFNRNPKSIPTNANKLFSLCEKLKMLFTEPAIKELRDVLEKHGHQAKIINMGFSGICSTCKSQLEKSKPLSTTQFNMLRTEFMDKVVKGADIYQKTTPEEWKSFEEVIRENGPFDIVMDGLNVSYLAKKTVDQAKANNQSSSLSKLHFNLDGRPNVHTLTNAVKQLHDEGKRVLVVGRKHMNRWPNINNIRKIATLFLVDNISKDDIFLLYAAMHSGQNSYILSNDFMRDHKFAIGRYNELFKLWQQEQWYGFTLGQNKPIELVKPMQYKMYIHKVGDYWHLPFKTNEHLEAKMWNSYELPEDWACIRIKENVECE